MKILFIVPSFYPATFFGGPVYYLLDLCNSLTKYTGAELRVLTTDSSGPGTLDRIATKDFPINFPAGYEVYYCPKTLGVSFSLRLIGQLWHMIKWADVVSLHGVYSSPTIPSLLISRILRKPVTWSPHGSLQRWEKTRRRGLKRVWESVCKRLCVPARTVLVTTSKKEGEESSKRINNLRTVTIPIGVNIPAYDNCKEWLKRGNLNLLFVGRLDPIKGIENLIHAIKLVNTSIYLSICGSGSRDYKMYLVELVKNLSLEDYVRFYGHVEGEAKAECFENADVLVLPSYTENFGIVVAEALAHGIPVIVSKAAPWEDIEKQQCGIWTDNSPEALAESIEAIRRLNLPEMGRNGKNWIEQNFSNLAIVRKWQRIFDALVSTSSN